MQAALRWQAGGGRLGRHALRFSRSISIPACVDLAALRSTIRQDSDTVLISGNFQHSQGTNPFHHCRRM